MQSYIDDNLGSYKVKTALIQGSEHLYRKLIIPDSGKTKKQTSRARLKVKKKTVKRGGICRIRVKGLNGQKVSYSVGKKTKKSGVLVNGKGLVRVKKSAKQGTYTVKVKVKANKTYKKKLLKFKVRVK